ncbi:MAG: T9SS type A sorting domain-containing protein [Bacteroidetes bacterium]|nr:T9SS type A sorting domain-containing protein [Bacteroidota bacterium]
MEEVISYLIKTDSTGNHVWSKAYGQTGSEEGKVVRQTTDGSYLIAGTSENALGPLGPNMCLIKTNSVGDTLWAKLYGGAMIDECYDAKQTSDGGYIMVGKSFSFSAAGDYDVYVVKVNAQGIAQWSKTYGGSATNHNEIGYSIDQTNDGGYIISGESMFGFGVGIVNMYLIKTDSLGNSGCNQGSAATLTSNYLPQVIATATLAGTGGNMKMPASLVNSGTTQTNLCLSGSTNIHDLNEDLSVTIYPNPFEEIINIAIEEISQLNSIKIYNVFGQEVYSQINLDKSYSSNKIVVELKDQKKGIFLIELRGESFDRTFKLIKQ